MNDEEKENIININGKKINISFLKKKDLLKTDDILTIFSFDDILSKNFEFISKDYLIYVN
jgi:hypothetical protein